MSLSLFKSQKLQDRMDLVSVEPCLGLTPFEQIFCLNYVQGARGSAAYLQALKKVEGEEVPTNQQAAGRALKLLQKETVRDYIDSLTKVMEKHGVISALEIQLFLTDAILTPLKDIDDSSPLCKKKIYIEKVSPDGTVERRTIYEKIDPLKAVDAMVKIKGLYAPIKVDMRHTGGVMLVPMSANLDEWETAAAQSQADLMADAIDV